MVPGQVVYQFRASPDPPVTVKVILPASSAQKLLLVELTNVGATGKAFIVTVCVAAAEGPLHPAAMAVIIDIPLHPAPNITSPVAELMELPPVNEAASSE